MRLNSSLAQQQGSMLAISIFIILAMTVLGVSMTNMLSASSDAVIYEVNGLRANSAARIGLERRMQEVFPLDSPTDVAACDVVVINLTNVAGLQNCQVSSSCNSDDYEWDAGASEAIYYTFISTGTCSAGSMIVSRTINVDAVER